MSRADGGVTWSGRKRRRDAGVPRRPRVSKAAKHCAVLGVGVYASTAEIKARWRHLLRSKVTPIAAKIAFDALMAMRGATP